MFVLAVVVCILFVAFHKSRFNSVPFYFPVHSSITFIVPLAPTIFIKIVLCYTACGLQRQNEIPKNKP